MADSAGGNVSIFEPHHIIIIDYPALQHFDGDGEHVYDGEALALPPIDRSRHRFEPEPLVQDKAVDAHSGRSDLDEQNIFVMTPADLHTEAELLVLIQDVDEYGHDNDLVRDMSIVTQAHGMTKLSCLSSTKWPGGLQDDDDDEEIPTMRISLCSTLKHSDPSGETELDVDYKMTMEEFDALETDEPWLYQLRSLMRIPQTEMNPDYANHLSSITNAVDLSKLSGIERECHLCANSFTDHGRQPLSLMCNAKHINCKACILKWLNTNSPDDATCPECRKPIFTNEAILDWLKFSVRDTAYYPDRRYNDWENFTRSCADLDKDLAEDDEDHMITDVDSRLMFKIWQSLMEGESLEPEESIPLGMLARSPECNHLTSTVETTLLDLDSAALTLKDLNRILLNDIHRAFARRLLRSSLAPVLPTEQKEALAMEREGYEDEIGLRPGFKEFYRRIISRMLQFVRLRICRGCCWGGRNAGFGWHGHGLRMHYRPTMDVDEEEEEDEEEESEGEEEVEEEEEVVRVEEDENEQDEDVEMVL